MQHIQTIPIRHLLVGDSIITGINNVNLHFIKYGAFTQISKTYFENKLTSSFGLRIDGNSFTDNANSNNFSPRIIISLQP